MRRAGRFRQGALQAALMLTLLAAGALQAAEVAGVRVDEQVRVGGSELVLNGAGLRSKLFIKIYVGALYVGQKASSPAAILDSPSPRRMAMRLLRDLDAGALQDALDDGLRANLTPDELAEVQPQAEQLAGLIKRVGKAREGDTLVIDFFGDGIEFTLNGEVRGKVAGAAFPKALLKVWLGERPVDAALKKALLGG